MKKPQGVSLFIPVFNEEELLELNLRRLSSYMKNRSIPFEIIIGSNGSFDRTVAMLQVLSHESPWLRYFHMPRKGVGKAFVQGVRMARFNCIVSLDMDLSIDLSFIDTACNLLSHNHIVVGSKKTGAQQRSLPRILASHAFIYCARALLGIGYSDYSIAAKAYRADTIMPYLKDLDTHTFYVVLILFKAFHNQKRILEVPVMCHDLRQSRFNLFHEGIYKFFHVFRLSVRERLLPILINNFNILKEKQPPRL